MTGRVALSSPTEIPTSAYGLLGMTCQMGLSSTTRFFAPLRSAQNDMLRGLIDHEQEIAKPRCARLAMTVDYHSEERSLNATWESLALYKTVEIVAHRFLTCVRNDRTGGLAVPNRDSHVGLRPPRNDMSRELIDHEQEIATPRCVRLAMTENQSLRGRALPLAMTKLENFSSLEQHSCGISRKHLLNY